MPWTDRATELLLIAAADASSDAHVTELGLSVEGREIHEVAFGPNRDPEGADTQVHLQLTGCLHGNEPAGREALLNLIDTWTTTPPAFLNTYSVTIIPTVNPDGFVNDTRANANDADLNRTWMALDQPETVAIAPRIALRQPLLIADLHEFIGEASSDVVQFGASEMRNGHAALTSLGLSLRDELIANAVSLGDQSSIWLPGQFRSWRLLDVHAQMRHGVGVLVETRRGAGSTVPDQDRLDAQEEAVAYILQWVQDNDGDLITASSQSRADQASLGAQQVAFIFRNGVIVDPAPLGYVLTEQQVSDVGNWLAVFDIDITDDVARMDQAARPAVGVLFDPQSIDKITDGVPLQVEDIPSADFVPILSGPHRAVFSARVLTAFQTGNDPDGVEIPIISGDVTYDATAEVLASLELTTSGISETYGDSMFPRRAADLLAPYGHEIFVRRGIDTGPQTIWSPLGYFRIDTVEQGDESDSPIRISGQDRMAGIIDGQVVLPYFFHPTRTLGYVVGRLVQDVYPNAVIAFDDDSDQDTIGSAIIVEQSRYAALQEIAESLGKIFYWDGQGVFRIEDPPDPEKVVWEINAGEHGVLVRSSRMITREGMNNGVVARGEGTSENPVQGFAVDLGKNSPTRWRDGQFGRVPHFFNSPLLKSGMQAQAAAESILRRRIGMPYRVNFGAVVNPALRPRDLVRIRQKDGNREKHHIETLTIPLEAGQPMGGTTREQTTVRVGPLTSGVFIP